MFAHFTVHKLPTNIPHGTRESMLIYANICLVPDKHINQVVCA